MSNSFSFVASVVKVTTLSDNGLRVAFDLQEDATEQARILMECKRIGIPLNIVATVAEVKQPSQSEVVNFNRLT